MAIEPTQLKETPKSAIRSSIDAPDSVGIVTPHSYHFDEPLQLRSGKTLPSYDLMVETYGELNAARSNAILITRPVTANRGGGIARSDRERQSTRLNSLSSHLTIWAAAPVAQAPRLLIQRRASPTVPISL
jgi:hypothetical protein